MCRRNRLRGCLVLGLGLGILIGYFLASWFLCCIGGIALIVIGLWMMKQK